MENKVCRTCLSSSDLNPIFLYSEDHDRCTVNSIYLTTGVKVTPIDDLPQDMCTNCISFVNKSLQFREKCRDTEIHLLKMKDNLEPVMLDRDKKNEDENSMKDTEHVAVLTHDTDKIIYEPKHEDLKVIKEAETIDVNTDIKKEYVNNSSRDDKPLKDWLVISNKSNVINSSVLTMSEENKEKIGVKNQEPEIIIPTAPPRRVSCQFCSKNLSIRSLNDHIAVQHPWADSRRVKCALCDKYVVRAKMKRHRKMKHGDGNTFMCTYCAIEYDSEELLKAHAPTCTAKKKQRRRNESLKNLAECHICHKKMLKASLRPHIAITHEGKGPVCEHCGRRFANNLRLGEHRRARHGHDKFPCPQCDYTSASLHTLKNHERRHRGERPFVCETCGTGFHSLHLLYQHRQSHRTQKLIKCDLCPSIFKANNSLHVHKMTCHSTAAYRCGLCARTFSCKNYATRHVRHVHSLQEAASVLERVNSETEGEG